MAGCQLGRGPSTLAAYKHKSDTKSHKDISRGVHYLSPGLLQLCVVWCISESLIQRVRAVQKSAERLIRRSDHNHAAVVTAELASCQTTGYI